MKVRSMVMALAALSMTGAAVAAGDQGASSASSMAGPSYAQSSDRQASHVREVQQVLQQQGYNPGPVDGMMGPRTERALRAFQQSQGMQATGSLDDQTLSALGVQQGSSAQNSADTAASSQPNDTLPGATPGNPGASNASSGAMGNTPNGAGNLDNGTAMTPGTASGANAPGTSSSGTSGTSGMTSPSSSTGVSGSSGTDSSGTGASSTSGTSGTSSGQSYGQPSSTKP